LLQEWLYILMKLHRLFLAALCFWLSPLAALAALVIDAPAEAPQGNAILIRLSSDAAVRNVVVRWQDTTFSVSMAAAEDKYGGLALVPMPLDATEPISVRVTAGNALATAEIRPVKVAWPKQNIQVEKKYVAPPPEVQKRIEDERRRNQALLTRISPERWWDVPCVRPAPGEVSSVFGGRRVFNGQPRSSHRGVDMRAATGQPILAMAGGRVGIAEEQYFSGNVVFIEHGQGLVSLYAHLSAFSVAAGDVVRAGQEIGLAGATGRVSGPHLHWGVNILGKPVDPLSLLTLR
jgi:murein DD-endopeptidase MepM/ murein hydrolase activator NlpD